ncbi:hypothetical protein HMI55_006392 [Coelomomyces lativittatus]|nr:hypothetical protein HMI55_006392 [Coelomomyces lativittatus]
MLHSCGSTKIVYHYPQTKTLKKWEVIPPGCKVNAPSLGYFSTETMFVFLLAFYNLKWIGTFLLHFDLKNKIKRKRT